MAQISVKADYQGELRRLTIPDDIELHTLRATLATRFEWNDASSLILKWVDDDGDAITLADEADLAEALGEGQCQGCLRIILTKQRPRTAPAVRRRRGPPAELTQIRRPREATASQIASLGVNHATAGRSTPATRPALPTDIAQSYDELLAAQLLMEERNDMVQRDATLARQLHQRTVAEDGRRSSAVAQVQRPREQALRPEAMPWQLYEPTGSEAGSQSSAVARPQRPREQPHGSHREQARHPGTASAISRSAMRPGVPQLALGSRGQSEPEPRTMQRSEVRQLVEHFRRVRPGAHQSAMHPADTEDVAALPTHRFQYSSGGGVSQECSVCLSELEAGDRMVILPCFHRFHKACCDEWLKRSSNCPICKMPVQGANSIHTSLLVS